MNRTQTLVSYRQLDVWRLAMDLTEQVYEVTERFPRREHFGLAAQLRRSAVSIPSNVAEGHRRPTCVYLNHVSISLGSHAELETQLEIARRRRFVDHSQFEAVLAICERVGQLLHGLATALERKIHNQGGRSRLGS